MEKELFTVYCSYHSKAGTCTKEDWDDAESGANPSRMCRVEFKEFGQAVPFHTLERITTGLYAKMIQLLG